MSAYRKESTKVYSDETRISKKTSCYRHDAKKGAMMVIRKTVFDTVTNTEQEGTVIDIVPAQEPMMSLLLADGTEIRIKNTIIEVVKFDHTNVASTLRNDYRAINSCTLEDS